MKKITGLDTVAIAVAGLFVLLNVYYTVTRSYVFQESLSYVSLYVLLPPIAGVAFIAAVRLGRRYIAVGVFLLGVAWIVDERVKMAMFFLDMFPGKGVGGSASSLLLEAQIYLSVLLPVIAVVLVLVQALLAGRTRPVQSRAATAYAADSNYCPGCGVQVTGAFCANCGTATGSN